MSQDLAPHAPSPIEPTGAAQSGARWFGVLAGIQLITSMAKLAILARSFEPYEIGLIAMLVTVSGYLGVLADMQLPSAIIQRPNPTRRELSSVFWFGVGFGWILAGILVVSSPQISSLIQFPAAEGYLKVLAIGLVLSPIAGQFQAILRKQMDFKTVTIAVIASTFVDIALLGALLSMGWGVWAVVLGQLGSLVALTLIVSAAVRVRGQWPSGHFRLGEASQFLSFGAFRVGARIVAETTSRLDIFIIQALIGPVQLGFYNIASRLISQPAQRISPIVNQIGFPVISSVSHDKLRVTRGFLRSVGLLTGLSSPIMLGLAASAPSVVEFMLGDQWLSVIPLVQALSLAALVRLINSAGGNVVLAMGKANWTLYFNLVALVLTAIVIVTAAAVWGDIVTVAYALIVEHLVLGVLYYYFYLRKLLGGFLKDYLVTVFHPLALASVMAVCVWLIGEALGDFAAISVFLVQVVMGGAIYGFLVIYLHRPLALEIGAIFLKGPLARLRVGPLREDQG